MAEKKTILVKTKGGSSHEYRWYSGDGSIYRVGGGFFGPGDEKVGAAKNLDDAITIIRNHAGDVTQVDIR